MYISKTLRKGHYKPTASSPLKRVERWMKNTANRFGEWLGFVRTKIPFRKVRLNTVRKSNLHHSYYAVNSVDGLSKAKPHIIITNFQMLKLWAHDLSVRLFRPFI